MTKTLLIINLTSGSELLKTKATAITKKLVDNGHKVLRGFTKGKNSAKRIVEKYGSGMDLIICCGGDGTLSEAVNGVVNIRYKGALGYIPAGTTNDFAHSVGLSTDIGKNLDGVMRGIAYPFDIGKFQQAHFIYTASFGLFTKSAYATPRKMKKMLGHLAYMIEGSKEFKSLKSYHVKAVDDRGRVYEDDYLFGAVSNSTCLGGLVHLDENFVDYNDGLFEVLLIKFPKTFAEFVKTANAIATNDFSDKSITLFQTKSITFFCDKAMPWTLDGEYHEGCSKINVENQMGLINLVYPK